MDLNTITEIVRQPPERPGAEWLPGDAWLAGGTWLFSQPQPQLRRLIDLTALRWPSLTPGPDGLEIAATCTIGDLYRFPAPDNWPAAALLGTCCEAFLASFKVWHSATVGGNICMSLPAGPMITMTVALEARYTLWAADGSERSVDAGDFVTGDNQNLLRPGEVLRSVHVPAASLRKRHAHRRFSLTKLGRSSVFLIGTQGPERTDLLLTITAGTTYPVRLRFDALPDADALRDRIDTIPAQVWFDDPNGARNHRRHLTRHFAEEIRAELSDKEAR